MGADRAPATPSRRRAREHERGEWSDVCHSRRQRVFRLSVAAIQEEGAAGSDSLGDPEAALFRAAEHRSQAETGGEAAEEPTDDSEGPSPAVLEGLGKVGEMSLRDQLQDDLKGAMRAQDAPRKSAIRMVLAAIQLALVERPEGLSDDDVLELIRKEVKRREEAVELMRSAGRDEMVSAELVELDILKQYLPAQLSDDELRDLAQAVIAQLGASSSRDMGRVMGALMPQVSGRADGRAVNQVVRSLLSA